MKSFVLSCPKRVVLSGLCACLLQVVWSNRATGQVVASSWVNVSVSNLGEAKISAASSSGVLWGDGSPGNLTNAALHATIDVDPLAPGAQAADLTDGQSLSVEGVLSDLKIAGPTSVPAELRVGVFHSRGKPGAEGWLGYFWGNSAGAGPGRLYGRNPVNETLFISVDGARLLASYQPESGGAANLTAGSYRFSLTLTRSGSTLRYEAKLVRTADGAVFGDFSGVDTRPATFVFDKIGFLAGRHLGAAQARLRDIRVSIGLATVAAARIESPETLPPGVVEIAPDGVWTWFNDERAVWHRGKLYAGHVTRAGDVGLSRYDPAVGKAESYVLGGARARQVDDHNNPSLVSRSDGRLLAVYSKHGSAKEFYTRISSVEAPAGPGDWGAEQVVAVPAGNTYANVYQLAAEGNELFSFHRCLNWNPTLSRSTDGGATWRAPTHFITAGQSRSVRPYIRLASNNVDRIDVLYTDGHPRDVENSVYHLYYKGGAFFETNGRRIRTVDTLPLDHAKGERGAPVYAYAPAFGRGWVWDVHYDTKQNPVAVFQTRRADVTGAGWQHGRIYYHYAVWTGTEWRSTFIAQGGRAIYEKENDYGGGMAIDPDDTRVVYIATNAARPFELGDRDRVPLAPGERFEIWRGFTADGGLTFDWKPITRGSQVDNLRPAVPANHGGSPGLLWVRGVYTTYTDYRTRIVGLLQAPAGP